MEADRFVHDMKNQLGIILGYVTLLIDDMAAEDSRHADLQEIRKAAEEAVALLDRLAPPSQEGV
jgi:hypothetical protein